MEKKFLGFTKLRLAIQPFSNAIPSCPYCVLCGEVIQGKPTVITDSGHYFCHECVKNLISTDHFRGKNLYIGKQIPYDTFRGHLPISVRNATYQDLQCCKKPHELPVGHIRYPFQLFSSEFGPSTDLIFGECVVCRNWFGGDDVKRMVEAKCGHRYCNECITIMVKACLRAENRFPLKCCGEKMSHSSISRNLQPEIREAFEERCEELVVKPKNRVYCPLLTCSAFAGSASSTLRSHLTCKKCLTKICIKCRQAKHRGKPCDFLGDSVTIAFRKLSAEKNWKSCPGCNRTVERKLNEGCYKITCRCLTQFCYVCCSVYSKTGTKKCKCRHFPYKGCLIRIRNNNKQKSIVHIFDILSKSTDNNIKDLLQFLTSLEDLEKVYIYVQVPCDIENCYHEHLVSIDLGLKSNEIRDRNTMVYINHESSSSTSTQSSEILGLQEELLKTNFHQL